VGIGAQERTKNMFALPLNLSQQSNAGACAYTTNCARNNEIFLLEKQKKRANTPFNTSVICTYTLQITGV